MSGRVAGRARVAKWPLVLGVVGLSLVASAGAAGQEVVNFAALEPARPHLVGLRAGVEYGFIAGIGYGHSFAIGARTLLVSGSVTVPWANADARDSALRAGAAVDLVGQHRWRLVGGLGGSVRGIETRLNRMASLAADGVLIGGYWSPRWFLAGEAGYDGVIATHITHSEHYREIYFPEARDGWYRATGGNVHYGLAGGLSRGTYDMVLRVGQARDRELRSQLLPAYLALELSRRF